MKYAFLLLSLIAVASAAGQEMSCIASVRRIQFDREGRLKKPAAPPEAKSLLPLNADVQLVVPLSSSETLTIYGIGESDADTRLLITRQGHAVARYAIKDLPDDHEWGAWLTAFGSANVCANGNSLTYIVLQGGNQGGYFVALVRRGTSFELLPIEAVQQGRLFVNVNAPMQITVWSVASEDANGCTGCKKHYVVKEMQLEGESFKTLKKGKTERKYESFQDQPLEIIR